MPEFASMSTAMLATAIAPTLQLRPQVLTRIAAPRLLTLSAIRHLTVIGQVDNAPHVQSAPDGVERAVAGEDGIPYFVPQARVAVRSEATRAPHVFLERRGGEVFLQVWFDLVRFPSLPTESKPLPVAGYTVSLVGSDGSKRIAFDAVRRSAGAREVGERRLPAVLRDQGRPERRDRTAAERRLGVPGRGRRQLLDQQPAPGRRPGSGPISLPPLLIDPVRIAPRGRMRVFAKPVEIHALAASRFLAIEHCGCRRCLSEAILATSVADVAQPRPTAVWATQTKRMSLGAADNSGVNGYYEPGLMENRAIYSQVTSGFGSEPWSEWVESPNGRFMDSPVPDQFYVLPDEYRLTFDAETKDALDDGAAGAAEGGRPSRPGRCRSAGDYTLRTRFSVVPWVDPARLERLRAEIAKHSGGPYPELLVGGIRSATVLAVGGAARTRVDGRRIEAMPRPSVDPLGFDLVLDCTSEFYSTLSHLLVTDGVGCRRSRRRSSRTETDPRTGRRARRAAPRPAGIRRAVGRAHPGAHRRRRPEPAATARRAEGAPPGEGAAATAPLPSPMPQVPLAPPTLRVINPLPYAVTVARAVPSLLSAWTNSSPSPLGAVAAKAEPESFTLPPATAGGALDDRPHPHSRAARPAARLRSGRCRVRRSRHRHRSAAGAGEGARHRARPAPSRARSKCAATSSSTPRCFHPRSPTCSASRCSCGAPRRPRRSRSSSRGTSRRLDVQVAFTLGDIMAGAKPEQPTFQWRARNMAGAGNGEWSEWAAITGRQLFVSPNGV